jgi:hypothetical protein
MVCIYTTSMRKCRVGKEIIEPCCDRKINRGCHFKDGIDFEKMREEHDDYKALEKQLPKKNKDIVDTLNEEQIDILDKLKTKRKVWLDKYYRDECQKCDSDGVNHVGYLRYLNKHYHNVTKKRRSRTPTKRAMVRHRSPGHRTERRLPSKSPKRRRSQSPHRLPSRSPKRRVTTSPGRRGTPTRRLRIGSSR